MSCKINVLFHVFYFKQYKDKKMYNLYLHFNVGVCSGWEELFAVDDEFVNYQSNFIFGFALVLWCLTPLSTLFQLYRGDQLLLVEENGVPGENHWHAASHWQTYQIILYRVVIGTHCIGSCKSMTTAMTVPSNFMWIIIVTKDVYMMLLLVDMTG